MILLHLLFAFLVGLHQLKRLRTIGADTLTFIGAGFALVYGIAPAYFYFTDADKVLMETGIIIPYADLSSKTASFGLTVFTLYVLAYIVVCLSYDFLNRRPVYRTTLRESESQFYLIAGSVCTLAGLASLGFYIVKLGGLSTFFSLSMYLRSDADAIFRYGIDRVAFLKNSSMILLAGAILASTGVAAKGLKKSPVLIAIFAISFIGSVVLLVHQSGRLFLGAFVGCFLIARFIGRKELPLVKLFVGCSLFAVFASVGKELFWRMALEQTVVEEVSVARVYHSMMSEILFAHIAATTAVSAVPDVVPYRMFSDIPIAIINLTPSSIFDFTKLKNVSDINTDLIATGSAIPVDLVGFGYYSAGPLGVALWACCFGALGGWLDALFRDTRRVWSVLRSFVAVTFGLRVAYSEPTHILISSFHIFIVLAAVLPFLQWARSSERKRDSRHSELPVRAPQNAVGVSV